MNEEYKQKIISILLIILEFTSIFLAGVYLGEQTKIKECNSFIIKNYEMLKPEFRCYEFDEETFTVKQKLGCDDINKNITFNIPSLQ